MKTIAMGELNGLPSVKATFKVSIFSKGTSRDGTTDFVEYIEAHTQNNELREMRWRGYDHNANTLKVSSEATIRIKTNFSERKMEEMFQLVCHNHISAAISTQKIYLP